MSVLLMPRLTALGVSSILESAGAKGLTPAVGRDLLNDRSAMLSFGASGGNRSEELAAELGARLREIAVASGFPDNSSQVARSRFDHDAAIYLGSHHELATGESLRDDIWSFLATIVLPDIVTWRYQDRASHRFEGGVRNTLQRLWMRGVVLDRGSGHPDRWALVRALSEDAAVQIFERASIAGSRALALALAEGWLQMADRIGRGPMEPIMRRAIKLLRLRNEIIDLASLSKVELDKAVSETFERVYATAQKTASSAAEA